MLTIKTHNRPIYLYRVLESLAKCRGINRHSLIISMDCIEGSMITQNKEAIELSKISDKTTVEIVVQGKKLGCMGHTRALMEYVFDEQGEEYFFHLEDDTVPGPNLIEYFEQVCPTLDEKGMFAACTFHRPGHRIKRGLLVEEGDIGSLEAKEWFDGSGGFAITRKQWSNIKLMGGMFAVDRISEKGRTADCKGRDWLTQVRKAEYGSFVWPFHKYFSKGQKSVYPYLGCVKNIGVIGAHISRAGEHSKMYNEHYSGDDKYKWLFEEDTVHYDLDNIIINNDKHLEFEIDERV